MQRVLGRHRGLTFNNFLVDSSHRSLPLRAADVHSICGAKDCGVGQNSTTRLMESSALNLLIGNVRHIGPVGEKRGLHGRNRIACRGYREDRKLVRQKSRGSKSVATREGFSAQRFLESAARLLRNLTSENQYWRNLLSSNNGLPEAEENKKHPLSIDTACKNKSQVVGEVAIENSGKSSEEFEWRSALWEAEVSCVEEVEGVAGKVLFEQDGSSMINVSADGSGSRWNNSASTPCRTDPENLTNERIVDTSDASRQSELPEAGPVATSYKASTVEIEVVNKDKFLHLGHESCTSSSVVEPQPGSPLGKLQLEGSQTAAFEIEGSTAQERAGDSGNSHIRHNGVTRNGENVQHEIGEPSTLRKETFAVPLHGRQCEDLGAGQDGQKTSLDGKGEHLQVEIGQLSTSDVEESIILQLGRSGELEVKDVQTTSPFQNWEDVQPEITEPPVLTVEELELKQDTEPGTYGENLENIKVGFQEQGCRSQNSEYEQDPQTKAGNAGLEEADGGVTQEGRPDFHLLEGVTQEAKPDFHHPENVLTNFREPSREQETHARIANEENAADELIVDRGSCTRIEEMENQELVQRLTKLRGSISHHAYLYNTLDSPVISDAAYDDLVKELEKLETQVSDTVGHSKLSVGAELSPALPKVQHSVPMLSLASVQKEEEVRLWYQRLEHKLGANQLCLGLVVEPKVDGLALSLRYEHGKLKYAATRGNGMQGEDVTHNAQKVLGIPLTIPQQLPGTEYILELLEVRGEIFMSLEHFRELNAAKLKSGEKPMANPRNAAAGSMRLLNSSNTKLRPLSFLAYSIANLEGASAAGKARVTKHVQSITTQWEALNLLQSIGFHVNEDNRLFKTFDSALEYARSWRDMRRSLKYEADGLVLKLNDLATQSSLGTTGGDPRWAIAWKFAATEAVTVLEGIELTVGRSGAIIPNARFKPVIIGGVSISRASLHNIGHVKSLGLCQGDHVVVQRAGDVIPQVVHVLEELRPASAKPWSPPQECPSCGSKLTGVIASTMVYCQNSSCTSRHSRQVEHFAKTLIPGLGSATLNQLEEDKLVMDPADFYLLDPAALSKRKGFGKLSVEKLLKAIEVSKQSELSFFILALGIPRVGVNLAKELEERFGSMQAILKAGEIELSDVPGIGSFTAAAIYKWCQEAPNVELIHRLEAAGCKLRKSSEKNELPVKHVTEEGILCLANDPVRATDTGKYDCQKDHDDLEKSTFGRTTQPRLHGKTIVITGDFGDRYREDMKELVKMHGGKVRTSVSSKTSFLLAGNRPGPVKVQEAQNRGVEILDWESFQKLIEHT